MKVKRLQVGFFALVLLYFLPLNVLYADEFHYINEMVGERGGGMGGAFTAIADDPSGSYYNPAGLAFAFDNQISLSVNTIRFQHNSYKEVVGGQDYSIDYQSFFPSFFGVVQTLGPGKFAFSVVINNTDIAEQYEFISNISTTATQDRYISLNFDLQDQTTLFGPSYSMQLSDKLTVGLTLFGMYRKRKTINNQITVKNRDLSVSTFYPFAIVQNNDTKRVKGLVTILGLQFMPAKKISIGFKTAQEVIFSHKEERHYIQKGATLGQNDSADLLLIMGNSEKVIPGIQHAMDFALGFGFFLSKNFILTADVKYYPSKEVKFLARDLNKYNNNFGYVNNELNINEPRYTIESTTYESVINGAVGIEYYATANFPIRLGAFSNRSNTKPVTSTSTSGEHIDFYGGTMGFAWQTANSSIALTGMMQVGSGKSYKYDGVKDATAVAYSFSLTGSSKY